MGIGWLANVLFFTDKLLFIAYIMTVFIAGQGIIIFILYVPLSKPVSLIIITSGYKCDTYRLERHTQNGGIIKRENLNFSTKYISLNQHRYRHQSVAIISLLSHFIF